MSEFHRRHDHHEHQIEEDILQALEVMNQELHAMSHTLHAIQRELAPTTTIPTSITFKENTLNPTAAGQSQVFTGTLVPAGSSFPTDAVFTVTSNDPAVGPTVDSTGLIVSVTYPLTWVESATIPLAFDYAAVSASNPTWSVTAVISPSAPPLGLPTAITFAQTT